jgi:hypothetical protein
MSLEIYVLHSYFIAQENKGFSGATRGATLKKLQRGVSWKENGWMQRERERERARACVCLSVCVCVWGRYYVLNAYLV